MAVGLPFNGTLYLSNIKAVPCSVWEEAENALPAVRKEQLARLAHNERRASSVAADCLLAAALKRYHEVGAFIASFTELSPSELTDLPALRTYLPYTAFSGSGKPYVNGIAIGQQTIFANLSHSGRWVVAGISLAPIGVDIQCCKETELDRCIKVFSRFHHPDEKPEWYQPEAGGITVPGFVLWWTLKESVVKLTGEGLSRSFTSFSIRPTAGAADAAGHYQTCIENKDICCFHSPLPNKNMAAAVALYKSQ